MKTRAYVVKKTTIHHPSQNIQLGLYPKLNIRFQIANMLFPITISVLVACLSITVNADPRACDSVQLSKRSFCVDADRYICDHGHWQKIDRYVGALGRCYEVRGQDFCK